MPPTCCLACSVALSCCSWQIVRSVAASYQTHNSIAQGRSEPFPSTDTSPGKVRTLPHSQILHASLLSTCAHITVRAKTSLPLPPQDCETCLWSELSSESVHVGVELLPLGIKPPEDRGLLLHVTTPLRTAGAQKSERRQGGTTVRREGGGERQGEGKTWVMRGEYKVYMSQQCRNA